MSHKSTLRKAIPLMHTLKVIKPGHRAILLDHLDDKAQRQIYEALGKLIHSSTTPSKHKEKLKKILLPHKTALRYLTDSKKPIHLKNKKVKRMGGQFGAILGAAIPILLDLILKGR